jgi:hypothetical protein
MEKANTLDDEQGAQVSTLLKKVRFHLTFTQWPANRS